MGDRGSIRVCEHLSSPHVPDHRFKTTLFRHWGGAEDAMLALVRDTKRHEKDGNDGTPPNVLLSLAVLARQRDGTSAYLGEDRTDGDNGDNGEYLLHTLGSKWVLTHRNRIIGSWGFTKGSIPSRRPLQQALTVLATGSVFGADFGPCPKEEE